MRFSISERNISSFSIKSSSVVANSLSSFESPELERPVEADEADPSDLSKTLLLKSVSDMMRKDLVGKK